MNGIRNDSELDRTWKVALPGYSLEDPKHTVPSDNSPIAARNKTDTIIEISKAKMYALIAKEDHSVYVERSQANLQTRTEKTNLGMLQLRNCSAAKRITTSSVRIFETVIVELFKR